VLVDCECLTQVVAETFRAAGCAREEGARIAEHLVRANLTGHDSHGVIRVPRYLRWLRDDWLRAGQRIEVVFETDAMAVVDGHRGFGQTIGPQAVQLGIEKARRCGAAVIALRSAGHLGRIGDWAETAAKTGQVSIHFVNVAGSVLVAPFGGTERRMGTNPVAIGVPAPGGHDLILDFATSYVAEGKVLVALKGGKGVPEGSMVDAEGRFTTDPRDFYGADSDKGAPKPLGTAALCAMGLHKGSGLSFMVELLAGVLTGSGTCGPEERPIANGMLSIYMQLEKFAEQGRFSAELREYVEFFKSARPVAAGGEVLVPGEAERRAEQERRSAGIPLPDETWAAIVAAARDAGVGDADLERILAGRG